MNKNWLERMIAVIMVLAMLLSAVSIAEELGEAAQGFPDSCEAQEEAVIAEPVEDAVPELEEFTLGETQTGEGEKEGESEQAVLAPPEIEYTDGDENMEDADGEYAVAAPASSVAINATNFPDANFREYVKRFDSNSDGWLSQAECNAVMEIVINDYEVESLEGIQFFINLEKLDCSENNPLQTLPLNSNTELRYLDCSFCNINSLDLSSNAKLQNLYCCCLGEMMTSLNVSCCPELFKLDCAMNRFTFLDVRKCSKLRELDCSENAIRALDLTANTQLQTLDCSHNEINELGVSSLTELFRLECSNNYIDALDVRKCVNLECLACDRNHLISLDVSQNERLNCLFCDSNFLDSLDISTCKELIWLVNNKTERYVDYGYTDAIIYWYNDVYGLSFPKDAALIINGVVVDGESNLYSKLTLSNVKSNGSATLSIGDLRQITPAFATNSGWTVKSYKSSKPKVASIDGNGLLTAKAEGTTKITVTTTNKKSATITVKVVDPYKPTGICISQGKSTTLNLGQTLQLGTTLSPSTAQSALTWKSSKSKVATVDANGLVTPKAEGTTKITVTTRNKKKATITIKVVDPYKPSGVSISQGKSATLSMGQTLQLGTTLAPSTAQTTLAWKSSKTKVATVDANGLVTPKAEGTTKITVTTRNKKKATITIKVVDPYKPTGVSITQGKSATLNLGETLQLSAALSPSTAQSGLTWKSSKSKVATVDASGLVTAVGKGTATITVTTRNGKKATCKITVKAASKPSTSGGRIELTNFLGVKFSSIRKALGVSNYGNDQIWFGSIGEPTGPNYAEVFCIENDPSAKYCIFGLNLGMSLSDAEAYLYSQGWEYEDNYSTLFDDPNRFYVLDSSTYTTLIIAYNTSGTITKLYVERI